MWCWCCCNDTQCECRSLISAGLFEEAASQQGPLPTGQAVWKEVRGRMAAASGARSALVNECPASCIGAILTMLLQQVSYHLTGIGLGGTADSAKLAIASSFISHCLCCSVHP